MFTDRHLQVHVGVITRCNVKTASVESDDVAWNCFLRRAQARARRVRTALRQERGCSDKHGGTPYLLVIATKNDLRDQNTPREGRCHHQWRHVMADEPAREIYKQRGANVECTNAQLRCRNLRRFNACGMAKATRHAAETRNGYPCLSCTTP